MPLPIPFFVGLNIDKINGSFSLASRKVFSRPVVARFASGTVQLWNRSFVEPFVCGTARPAIRPHG